MAGPAATVLVPRPLSDADRAAVRALVEAARGPDLLDHPDPDAFWVRDTRPAGGGYVGEGRPFLVAAGARPDREAVTPAHVAAAFGFAPRDELLVVAFCNRPEDHLVLGELCLWLADRFDGVIDFGGTLWPPLPPGAGVDVLDPDWRQVEPHFRAMTRDLPGRVVGVPHDRAGGRAWVTHVADVAFLRAWLGHPRFHMVK